MIPEQNKDSANLLPLPYRAWQTIRTRCLRRWHWILPPAISFFAGLCASHAGAPQWEAHSPASLQDSLKPLHSEQYWLLHSHTTSTEAPLYQALFILLNNLRVACITFLGSAFWGLPGLWACFENGRLAIGVPLLSSSSQQGFNLALLTFILPHSLPECLALWLASGAGLLLGIGTLLRGQAQFWESVIDSAILASVSGLLFIVAAIIETFQLNP